MVDELTYLLPFRILPTESLSNLNLYQQWVQKRINVIFDALVIQSNTRNAITAAENAVEKLKKMMDCCIFFPRHGLGRSRHVENHGRHVSSLLPPGSRAYSKNTCVEYGTSRVRYRLLKRTRTGL